MASRLSAEPLGRPEPGQILIVIREYIFLVKGRIRARVLGNSFCIKVKMALLTLLDLDDFSARSSDELTLSKGDRVELVERDDEFGDGWYLGRHLTNGATGLFPEG